MADNDPNGLNRRGFFGQFFGLVAAASTLTLLKPSAGQEDKTASKQVQGYRETEHVRQYYRSARG